MIGARTGSYAGMAGERKFEVRWIKEGGKPASDLNAAPDASVDYQGAEVTVGP